MRSEASEGGFAFSFGTRWIQALVGTVSLLPALSSDSPLHRELSDVPGIPTPVVKSLGKEGVKTMADVLAMLPFRHEDRNRMEGQTFQASDVGACYHVLVVKTGVKFFGKSRGGNFEAVVQHANGNALGQQMTLRWWGMGFMSRVIIEGQELIVHGKVKDWKGRPLHGSSRV